MQKRGMTMDFSWKRSALKYVELYEDTIRAQELAEKALPAKTIKKGKGRSS
jgi:hypothetical protein